MLLAIEKMHFCLQNAIGDGIGTTQWKVTEVYSSSSVPLLSSRVLQLAPTAYAFRFEQDVCSPRPTVLLLSGSVLQVEQTEIVKNSSSIQERSILSHYD